MIRLTFLWLLVFGILGYSWKDWYRGLCGLILLMAVIEHPDMPKSILGIPGLNPWNLLMFNVVCAWAVQRGREGLTFDLPRKVTVLLIMYLAVILLGFVRIIGDTAIIESYYEGGTAYFITEYLVNTIKWVIPGLLLYDGCRSEERFRLALFSILAVYVLLAVQVAKWVPPQFALDPDALERRSLRVLVSGMGYHRVNLSAMLSGASWAVLCARVMVPLKYRMAVLLTMIFVVYAQMMTGGRAGYGAWMAVGLALSVIKWRRFLLLIPAAAMLATILLPGVVGRAMEGFTEESRDTNTRLQQERQERGEQQNLNSEVDAYTVTAGRSVAWPLIIEGIKERPWFGLGRQAMLRSGIATYLYDNYGEVFPHPHNAYLELLLDNGIVGFVVIIPFYVLMLWYSVRMFLDRQSMTCAAIGGASFSLILSLMVSAMGSQTFYPREGWMGMWCVMMLMLRVRMERQRRAATAAANATASDAAEVNAPVSVWGAAPARPALPGPRMPAPHLPLPGVPSPAFARVATAPAAPRPPSPAGAARPVMAPGAALPGVVRDAAAPAGWMRAAPSTGNVAAMRPTTWRPPARSLVTPIAPPAAAAATAAKIDPAAVRRVRPVWRGAAAAPAVEVKPIAAAADKPVAAGLPGWQRPAAVPGAAPVTTTLGYFRSASVMDHLVWERA